MARGRSPGRGRKGLHTAGRGEPGREGGECAAWKAPPARSSEIRGAGCQGKLQIDSRAPHTLGVWISRRWKELQQPDGLGSIIHQVTAAPCNSCSEAVLGWMLEVPGSFPMAESSCELQGPCSSGR